MATPRRHVRLLQLVLAFAIAAALAGASAGGRAAASSPSFVAVDLGTLGGTSSVATAINGVGQVAGMSATADGSVHAFVWDAQHGMQDVGSLGGRVNEVAGISSSGQIVGSSFTATNALDAFSWTASGGLVDIPGPVGQQNHAYAVSDGGQALVTTGGGGGGLWTAAGGLVPVANAPGTATFTTFFPATMNNSGQIVGFGYTADDPSYYHAFSWTASAGAVDLGRTGVSSVARAVAETGEVFGRDTNQGASTAWAWAQSNGFTELPFAEPLAVNVAGQVVGSDGSHLFFFDPAGAGTEELGTLGGATTSVPPFNGYANYHLLNRNGQVVGQSDTAADTQHAFSWTHAGGLVDLGTLGGTTSSAYAVNDRGQVVGTAALADGTAHAVLWQPQTAPANDAFSAKDPIWLGTGTNHLATKEPGEPDHAGNPGGASVWYGIPAHQLATATSVSIDSATFDTTLAVYTGSSVDGLTLVAANDNATADGTRSKVCFIAQPDTFYYVAVDGYDGASGDFQVGSSTSLGTDPCPMLPPTISGTPTVGSTLTSSAGTFYGVQLPGRAYQWTTCTATGCEAIAGATSATFTPTAAQVGLRLGVVVTARHGSGATQDASSNSALTSPVAPASPEPGSISGRVTNAAGQPIAGIWVAASTDAMSGTGILTGADGTYTITGLMPGDYTVRFQGGGYVTEWYAGAHYYGAATKVPLAAGEAKTGIDEQLTLGGSISGSVTDEQGQPLAGMSVYASGGDYTPPAATTAADGTYTIESIAPGAVVVRFSDPTSAGYAGEYYDDVHSVALATRVTVTEGAVTSGIDAKLTLAGAITGRVTDAAGDGLAQVTVHATPADGKDTGLEATTGADGRYKIWDVGSGSYLVRFADAGSRGYLAEYYDNARASEAATSVRVDAPAEKTGIDAQLVTSLQEQTIAFAPLPDRTLGDPPFALSATATSALPVSFSVEPGSGCTLAGTTLTLTGAGACSVTAAQAGNADFDAAAPVTRTFTITAPDFALAAAPSSRTAVAGTSVAYEVDISRTGGFDGAVELTVAGLPTGATASFGGTTLTVATAASTGAASYTLTVTGTGGGKSHTASVTLVVQAPQQPPPSGGGGGGGGHAADLAISGTVTPSSARPGETLVWRFRVDDTNLGPAVDVSVDLRPSSNLTVVGTVATRGPGCRPDGAVLHCLLDWMSGDARTATITLTTTAAGTGDYTVSGTVRQLIAESSTANNTVTVRAAAYRQPLPTTTTPTTTTPTTPKPTTPTPTTPTPPQLPAAPVIGKPVLTPVRATAGKRLVVTFRVTRSDTKKPLATGRMICDPSVAGKVIRHAESFRNGTARLAFTIPKSAKGKQLKVKVTIRTATKATTRIATLRVR